MRRVARRLREARMFARAVHSPDIRLAQIVPIRRCNLACTYCNEFDSVWQPVPVGEMVRRVDLLAGLGTIITVSGGEPTLHPELDKIIRQVRRRGAIATLITNGLLLTPERIRALGRAGLDYLQISIDNVIPDETSKKSLKVLDEGLRIRTSVVLGVGAAQGLCEGSRLRISRVQASGIAVLGGEIQRLSFPPLPRGLRVRRWSKPAGEADVRPSQTSRS